MFERNSWKRDCSDEELLEDAIKRAYPLAPCSETRFQSLIARLNELEKPKCNAKQEG